MISPEQLAKPGTEDAHQMALMCWAALNADKYSELRWLHHIPNGGQSAQRGAKMRATGLKSGVWDLHLPVRHKVLAYSGLYIEMKIEKVRLSKNGGLSDNQVAFGHFVANQGFKLHVCYSWKEASEALETYLSGN